MKFGCMKLLNWILSNPQTSPYTFINKVELIIGESKIVICELFKINDAGILIIYNKFLWQFIIIIFLTIITMKVLNQ